MQLVLGAQIGSPLGTAGAPLPAPPERWRLGPRGRLVLRRVAWLLAFAAIVALGALHGATLAIGSAGVSALASAEVPQPGDASGERELQGAFWKPERSSAERPPARIAPRRWTPAANH
jgi:hypothetical protein